MREKRENTEGTRQRKLGNRTESGKQRNKELKVKTHTGSVWVTTRGAMKETF